MPLNLALAVRETVAGHRLGALEGGVIPPPPPLLMHPCPCPPPLDEKEVGDAVTLTLESGGERDDQVQLLGRPTSTNRDQVTLCPRSIQ